ncbi:MAG TPA: ABC transporter substrate-binding protein, partial [Dehalococcoidia bacterium]|nr:ABC transporter substrate-binding protein [Dehalococcoidia bacterium]
RFFGGPFPYLSFYSSIASVEAPDPQTVVFKMKAPDATFLTHLSVGFAWILAREAGKPDPKGIGGLNYADGSAAIGTGPFMLDQYAPESKLTFVRNPQYWETGLPYLDRIESQILVDPAPQAAALQTGQAMVGTLPTDSALDFKGRNPKLNFFQELGISNWHVSMRTDQAPFSDIRVRRALAMAWDQDEVKKIWGIPADSPSSFGSLMAVAGPAYLPLDQLGDNAQWWRQDLAGAKQLLAAAGYPNGFAVDYNDDTTIAHTTGRRADGRQHGEDRHQTDDQAAGTRSVLGHYRTWRLLRHGRVSDPALRSG